MSNPYEQAGMIASPWARAFSGAMDGARLREEGFNKASESLARRDQMAAHANLLGEQARLAQEKIADSQQRRQYQTPEFASRIAAGLAGLSEGQGNELSNYQQNGNWGYTPEKPLPVDQAGPPLPSMPKTAPSWYNPQVEQRFNQAVGAHLANLGGTGNSDAKNIAEAYRKIVDNSRVDQVMADPRLASALGQAVAASEGKALVNNLGNAGTFNQFTGQQDINGIGRSEITKNNAAAGNSSASAALHRAQIPEVQARTELTRSKIGQQQTVTMPDGTVAVSGPPPKPMPVGALKLIQEENDELKAASDTVSKTEKYLSQLNSGDLRLGLANNISGQARNFVGLSDANSRNLASFKADLEKMRNDSLRLNKGVQTEGDAQRAWNELFANINDPEVVKQRLAEIAQYNKSAMDYRRSNINSIRANFGYSPEQQQTKPVQQMSQQDRFNSVANAKKAIASGKDKAAVLQMLEAAGITDHGIK